MQRDIGVAFFIAIKLMQTQPTMNTLIPAVRSTAIGGRYPKKPVLQEPLEQSKQVGSAEALKLLNDFIREIRKEIRELDNVLIVGAKPRSDWKQINFIGDNFGISINFEEGGIA